MLQEQSAKSAGQRNRFYAELNVVTFSRSKACCDATNPQKRPYPSLILDAFADQNRWHLTCRKR